MSRRSSEGVDETLKGIVERRARLDIAFRAAVQEQMHEVEEEGAHPDPEELVAYQERRVSDPRQEEIAEHLSLCPDCAGLVLDLAAFDEVEEATDEAPVKKAIGAPPRSRPASWPGWIAAAAMLVLAVGLALVLPRGERLPTSVGWMYMSPASTLRGESQDLELPPGARYVTLVLGGAWTGEFQGYRVEVLAPDGGVVWYTEEAELGPDGTVAVLVPVEPLSSRVFEVQLSGRTELGWEILNRYPGRLPER